MQTLRFLFSPTGRLEPRAFVFAAIVVYSLGVAAQWLTMPDILLRAGIWPFAVAQALLVWAWYVLHARRLHDAGRPVDLAAGAALLYGLSIVLLLIVTIGYFKPYAGVVDPNATAALNIILLIMVVSALTQSASHDVGVLIVTVLMVLALLPVIVAVAVTLWAATRPSGAEPKP
ncbi:MAG: hypothetical protein ABSE50_07125 [Xanthobacteraceae bacterium]|jgi:uncharacterized membrane protein YhaH (DUF805 family)